jgi:hypothetical protein
LIAAGVEIWIWDSQKLPDGRAAGSTAEGGGGRRRVPSACHGHQRPPGSSSGLPGKLREAHTYIWRWGYTQPLSVDISPSATFLIGLKYGEYGATHPTYYISSMVQRSH